MELIAGIHSIAEALKNPNRTLIKLVATDEGLLELRKKINLPKNVALEQVSSHKLQEEAKKYCDDEDFVFQRIPSGIFLLAESLPELDPSWIYEEMEKRPLKILALDQVTDVHNAAAIMRTAAFYAVDAILIGTKGNFGTGPSFSRIASGALEHVKIVRCASLSRTLSSLIEKGIFCVGFSEHAEISVVELKARIKKENSVCLVMGAEDVGISHATLRVLPYKVAINAPGKIKSLNVSVATAVALEKFWGQQENA